MMIAALPVIQLLLVLISALLAPLMPPAKMKIILGVALILNVAMGVYLLQYVQAEGPIVLAFGGVDRALGIEFVIDAFSLFFTTFVSVIGLLIHIYSLSYVTHGLHESVTSGYYGLLSLLYVGVIGLLYTNDLFNTYVFIEILSITTCAMISVARKKRNYMAAFRYLMLNELGSLSFLMGVALIYMVTGSLNMTLIAKNMPDAYALFPVNVTLSFGLMGVGLAMKAAIFPFHEWLPDAHSSAPAPSSALLSGVVVKLYLLVMVKMIFTVFGVTITQALNAPLVMVIFASTAMIVGSLFALGQKDTKRMLAYSTVSQVGYMVLALSLLSVGGLEVMFFYIVSHALIKGTLFLVTGATIHLKNRRSIKSYQGLGYLMPLSMGAFTVAAFGMVGIPGTSGFIAKFDLAVGFINASQGGFVALLILSSILNAIYYFPIVIGGFVSDNDGINVTLEKLPVSMLVVMFMMTLMIITLGFAPGLIMPYIEAAAEAMGGTLT